MELNDSCSTCLAVAVDDRLLGRAGHHRLADLVAGLRPDVDDLVVALAVGHQTDDVLLLDLLDLLLGALDQAVLLRAAPACRRCAIEMPARGGQAEADVQQLVGEDHGLLQAALAERRVDQVARSPSSSAPC